MIVYTDHKDPLPAVCALVKDFIVTSVDEAKQQGMPGLKLQLGYMWSNADHIGADSEFVSLKGWNHLPETVYVKSVDKEVRLSETLHAWFPANSEFAILLEPNMYLAPDTKLLHSEQRKSLVQRLQLCPIQSTTPISHLLSDTHVHECLQKVAEVMDKEEDVICDDWRRLWCDLLERPFSEEMKTKIRETASPTLYVLGKWIRKLTSATVGKLMSRLSAIYRNDVAEILMKYLNEGNSKLRTVTADNTDRQSSGAFSDADMSEASTLNLLPQLHDSLSAICFIFVTHLFCNGQNKGYKR
ncbi:uncharacterized protein LOC134187544 isoform X2 [Corticium candelabrum]|nr:uncharacterized protein LOC134187544 isoform X2 [Corticium candelabrum]